MSDGSWLVFFFFAVGALCRTRAQILAERDNGVLRVVQQVEDGRTHVHIGNIAWSDTNTEVSMSVWFRADRASLLEDS